MRTTFQSCYTPPLHCCRPPSVGTWSGESAFIPNIIIRLHGCVHINLPLIVERLRKLCTGLPAAKVFYISEMNVINLTRLAPPFYQRRYIRSHTRRSCPGTSHTPLYLLGTRFSMRSKFSTLVMIPEMPLMLSTCGSSV